MSIPLEAQRLGLDGATPGRLGAGPHELSLLNGIASFSIGAMARGANTALTLTGAGGAGSANAASTTVQAVEYLRLTHAQVSLGAGFFEGGVQEVLVYRLADGTRSIGVRDAALSLAGITELNASMRYENDQNGYRLSAGGTAMIIGGTGFGAAGFFSNRNGQLGAGLFVAANANIPLLPPLISLAGIGGGLFINPTGEDVQMVLDVVENMGMRLVGAPPTPETTIGFAAFLYANAGLLGVAGGYAIEGKAFLQVTTVNTRIDVRGVLLGQTDHLTAGVSVEVRYGDGWDVTGAGEANIDFPGVDGHAQLAFLLGSHGGNFTWAIEAQASLDVVAFNASGAFFASPVGFYAEVGIGNGFSYGPIDIGVEVVVGVFLDASRPKFGAFGIVSAHIDLEVVAVSATLKGALVITGDNVYLGFGGVAHARVAGYDVSAAVHASFDGGDFSAGLGRDKKLDRIIADMRSTAHQIEREATAAASDMRAAAAANWWHASEQTLEGAGYALLNLSAANRNRVLAPVLAAEALTVLPAAEDRGSGYSLSPSALKQWVFDNIYSDPSRPKAADANASKADFEGAVAATGSIAAAVLDRVHLSIDGIATGAAAADGAGPSPLSVQATPGQPLRLSLDLAAYDAVLARTRASGDTDSSLAAATAVVAQAERALNSLDAVLTGSLLGGGATLADAGFLFALSHDRLQAWQAERVALGHRADRWSDVRAGALSVVYGSSGSRYRFGWGMALGGGLDRYAQLTDAAVARRRAILELAALSPTFAGATPLADAQSFRAQLLALERTPGRDGPFLDAVAGTWRELWFEAPHRGLLAVGAAAEDDALALLPALAEQRDSLSRRHQVLTTAVDALYEGRLALTAQVAALYDDIRTMGGAPPAWTTRRNVLMQDLEPPSLGGIQVRSTTANGVATNAISYTASHPNGFGGFDAAARRDFGAAVPQFIGFAGGLTTTTVKEAAAGDFQRHYRIAVKARSRAGASVTRAANVDVDVPASVQAEGSSSPPVQNPPDPAPAAPVVAFLYTLSEPLPIDESTQGLAAQAAGGFRPDLLNNAGVPDFNAHPPGSAPPPAADTRVYFSHDRTSVDVDVAGLNLADLAALEVAIGTTPNGVDVRPFAVAPAMPTASGHRRILLRGLALERDIDYWVRVRARDAGGQLSVAATTARPLRIDDRAPPAPTARAVEFRVDSSALVRLNRPDEAPSGFRKYEFVVSRGANGADAFDIAAPMPWGADSVVIGAADLTPGQSTWLHIRSVTYAGMRGPIRSIEARPPVYLLGASGPADVGLNLNAQPPQAVFGLFDPPVLDPPPLTQDNLRPPGRPGGARIP